MPLDQEPIEGTGREMPFLEHLEELRWHIIRSMMAIFVFTIFAFFSAPWIFENIIFAPAKPDFPTFQWICKLGQVFGTNALCIDVIPFKIQSRQMTGQFSMHIMASFVIGIVMAFPYVIWEIWRFIRPGLYDKEQSGSRGAVAAISFLFLTGVSFGYFVIAPMMVYFLATYSISDIIVNEFDITSYVSTVVTLVLGSGLLFQLPVIIFFLTKMGILSPKLLRQYRRHSIVAILIIAAIVTPPDIISQVLISVPLYFLFEISIVIATRVEKARLKREEEERLKENESSTV